MTEPRTAAGRALLDSDAFDRDDYDRQDWLSIILAIEAEAAQPSGALLIKRLVRYGEKQNALLYELVSDDILDAERLLGAGVQGWRAAVEDAALAAAPAEEET